MNNVDYPLGWLMNFFELLVREISYPLSGMRKFL